MNKNLLFLASAAFCITCINAKDSHNVKIEPNSINKYTIYSAKATTNKLVTAPEGTPKNYAMSLYFYVNSLQPDYDEYDLKNELVFSQDGQTVWFKSLFMDGMDGYAKGVIADNKITISSGQYVSNDESGNKLYLIAFGIDSNSNASFVENITFSYNNGHMRSTDDDVYLALATYNEIKQTYSITTTYAHEYIFDEVTTPETKVPEGFIYEQYMLDFYDNWRGGSFKRVIDLARKDNDVYVNGLAFDAKQDFIKGAAYGNEIAFESGQPLYSDDSFWLRLDGANTNSTSYVSTTDFTLTIADDETMSLEQDALCEKYMFDGGNYDVITNVKLSKYSGDVAATPASPKYMKCVNSSYGQQVTFVLPLTDVDGKDINPANLYYRIYLDGEVYTFKPETYQGVTEAMTLVPCYYYNNYTFNEVYKNKYKLFYFGENETSWKQMAVESVYIIDGVEYVSPEKSIAKNPNANVNDIDINAQVIKEKYIDLLGREVSQPQKGNIYIKSTTYDNGQISKEKVIVKSDKN